MPLRPPFPRRVEGPPSRWVSRALLAVSLVLALGACSDDVDASVAPVSEQRTAPAEQIDGWQLDTRVTRVAGRLPERHRAQLARRVGKLLHRHLEAAYLGDHPMRRAPGAFADFTPGARKQAMADRDVLTATGFGRVQAVEIERAAAYVAVLAPERHVVGATARLEVDLQLLRGQRDHMVRVRGRLLLTPSPDGWRVFGYDVSRSGVPKAGTQRATGAAREKR